MAGRQSLAMSLAIMAIKSPNPDKRLTPPEAAKKYGIKVNSIYRRPAYKEWRKAQEKAND